MNSLKNKSGTQSHSQKPHESKTKTGTNLTEDIKDLYYENGITLKKD
jgi:hypothetical protein